MAVTFDNISSLISACAASLELTGRLSCSVEASKVVHLHLDLSGYDKLPKENNAANKKAKYLIQTIYGLVKNLLKNCSPSYDTKFVSLNLSHTAVSGKALFSPNKSERRDLWNHLRQYISKIDFSGTNASLSTIDCLNSLPALQIALFDSCDKIDWAKFKSKPLDTKPPLKQLSIMGQIATPKLIFDLKTQFPYLEQLTCSEKSIGTGYDSYSTVFRGSSESSDEDMLCADEDKKDDVVYKKVGSFWERTLLKKSPESTSVEALSDVWETHLHLS